MKQPPRVPSQSGAFPRSTTVDLAVSIGSLTLRNPIVTASGTFGSGLEYANFVDIESLGAVVTKGVSPVPWPGNEGRRIAETPSGMLNSIGLQNPGVERFAETQLATLREVAPEATVIVNVVGHTADEYRQVVERLESEPNVAAYELNVSCPNLEEGGMAFGVSCPSIEAITRGCRAVTSRPIIVKLTPNVTDITETARAAESAGADAVSLINTLLGMAIDLKTMRPVLRRVVGGLSGPAIKPVALRMVWETSKAVDIPIIGMGGAVTGEDVVEFMLAGASAVAIGTANFTDPTATAKALNGLVHFCENRNIHSVASLIGSLEV